MSKKKIKKTPSKKINNLHPIPSPPLNLSEKQIKIFSFSIKFFLIFFVLEAIINLINLSLLTEFLTSLTANFSGLSFSKSTIFVNSQSFVITNSCTGLVSASILAAVIFSLKKPTIKKKILLLAAGTIILLLANIPRIILVLYSAMLGLDADLVHTLTWFLMSAIVLTIWYYGTQRMEKIKEFRELL